MPDRAPADLRAALLSRMGIPTWQLRHPLPASPAGESSPVDAAGPDAQGLWLIAARLPAQSLLEDLCAVLEISPSEVALLPPGPLPAGQPRWLWLTQPDPARPGALICPLNPTAAEKRALWQQIRTHHD
ncbi:DNA polymerase III subunit psi [Aeromonas diversa]|uniref:DNA polymerase III subunit psi n=1 Tax=Aeromonas diversa TaxID=502790 RepID=UPI0034618AE7